jgi:hypothetical protein
MPFCDRDQVVALMEHTDTIQQAGHENKHLSVGDTWSLVIQYYSRLHEDLRRRLEMMDTSPERAMLANHTDGLVRRSSVYRGLQ